ncbi:MAG: hypothetical protein LBK58_06260 [Prevotellaceae bacterium]|jgi:hypothetical protein|nr:hypothetical protein [Prevotellaceae bacterium]
MNAKCLVNRIKVALANDFLLGNLILFLDIRTPVLIYRLYFNPSNKIFLWNDILLRTYIICIKIQTCVRHIFTLIRIDKISFPFEKMGLHHEKIGMYREKMGMLHEKMGLHYEKMGMLHEKVGLHHEKMGMLHEKVRMLHKKMGLHHEKMGMLHKKVGLYHEKMSLHCIKTEIYPYNKDIIPRAGQFCALQTDAVRRPIQISPNRRSAVRGTAYTSPQLRKELNSFFPSNSQGIELLRSSDGTWTVDPELRFACTGLSKLDACGVKRHEVSLHFYLTILARAQYKLNKVC